MVYEYECLQCQYRFEAQQKLSDAPLKVCEKCGGELQKLVSVCSFQLVGNGFHKTDYSKESKHVKPKGKNG